LNIIAFEVCRVPLITCKIPTHFVLAWQYVPLALFANMALYVCFFVSMS
jgi:hypothetical protein